MASNAPVGKPTAMSTPHVPKVAGIDSTIPAPPHTAAPLPGAPATAASTGHDRPADPASRATADRTDGPQVPAPGLLIQDRLAGWVSDLTTLHELTERLVKAASLDRALRELLTAGAALVGARRGMAVLEPADGLGPATTIGLGLAHADLGTIETLPRHMTGYGRLLEGIEGFDGTPGARGARGAGAPDGLAGRRDRHRAVPDPIAVPDVRAEEGLDPRHREVAARLGYAASYALPLATEEAGGLGAAVWLYDEPAEPTERQRHLVGLYARFATEHLARLLQVERARADLTTVAGELLPSRLPRVPGVRLAARHRTGPRGGGDWYDALPLPEGALGLAVGSVTGSGPSALAAMGRLRASLRAYAVMEGEDPVAVLSDLELLMRVTEPARAATALFAYAEPARRRLVLAGAGHAPPLIIGDHRTTFVETTLSAPLGMLSCWEAPSVELSPAPGETVLLYTDGLLRRTGDPVDRAFARLHAAASGVPRADRADPDAVVDHVLRTLLPDGPDDRATDRGGPGDDDVVLLAARFD
jgi:hypothetical protein